MKGLIGKKLGMAQIFDDAGRMVPVTIIEAGPCFVAQVRTKEKEGYSAVQIGFAETKSKRLAAGELGHLQKASLPPLRHLRELRIDSDQTPKPGDKISVDIFKTGEKVDVIGTSKGKGFQGGMKRHGFGGGPITHGQSDRQRAPGAIGSTTTPGRIYKGKRMAGHMGSARVTSSGLRVALVDSERNLLGVAGSVPGPKGGIVIIREARKQ
ncbi:MAG: 50S ribosomal protein L3 [Anaerolineales bacterium]|nr:50S ribosomal protein L3 [Anaerolineales bacterium]